MQYTKYVGYDDSFMPTVRSLFNKTTILFIQKMVYDMSKAHFQQGVLVNCEVIANVLNTVFANFVPPTGGIYSRYTIPVSDVANNDDISNIISQTARSCWTTSSTRLELSAPTRVWIFGQQYLAIS